jgi:hypothetical protein
MGFEEIATTAATLNKAKKPRNAYIDMRAKSQE